MARVMSMGALAGMPTGKDHVTSESVAAPFVEGRYVLDGRAGSLEIAVGTAPTAEATLTAAGLSALVYGVLDPDDLVVRGLGDVTGDPAARLRRLFPGRVPFLYAPFSPPRFLPLPPP